MQVHPITPESPACLGVCCPLHPSCARYAAAEGAPPTTIATCEREGARPLFVAVVDSEGGEA
jgi:hypothetical protein